MKLVTILLSGMLLALPAFAVETKDTLTESDVAVDRVACDTNGCDYYRFLVGGETFDNTGGFMNYGPLATDAGCTIENVVLAVEIEQTWVGDLIIELWYDEDNDGVLDYGPVSAMCRPDLDGCDFSGCCGCSGNIAGVYTFGDDGADPLGEFDCPSDIAPGCFAPAPESAGGFADMFAGAATGGAFYLDIADGAGGDPTTLFEWGVYVCCGSTASENTSWGQIKSDF